MSFQANINDGDELLTEINVTPFVDVVLVLLIFFMLAAPVAYQASVKVQLPTVRSTSPVKHITLQFYQTQDGQLFLQGDKIRTQQLESIVKKALSLDPYADALLAADKNLAHGAVLETLDALRQAGLHEIGLGVETAKPQGKKTTQPL